mgnify:CR=1 FL=1
MSLIKRWANQKRCDGELEFESETLIWESSRLKQYFVSQLKPDRLNALKQSVQSEWGSDGGVRETSEVAEEDGLIQ